MTLDNRTGELICRTELGGEVQKGVLKTFVEGHGHTGGGCGIGIMYEIYW